MIKTKDWGVEWSYSFIRACLFTVVPRSTTVVLSRWVGSSQSGLGDEGDESIDPLTSCGWDATGDWVYRCEGWRDEKRLFDTPLPTDVRWNRNSFRKLRKRNPSNYVLRCLMYSGKSCSGLHFSFAPETPDVTRLRLVPKGGPVSLPGVPPTTRELWRYWTSHREDPFVTLDDSCESMFPVLSSFTPPE